MEDVGLPGLVSEARMQEKKVAALCEGYGQCRLGSEESPPKIFYNDLVMLNGWAEDVLARVKWEVLLG